MDESVKEAIHGYYKLKHKYDETNQRKKKQILGNQSLAARDKKQKWMQFKRKCVKCGAVGGTTFTNSKNILSATCNGLRQCDLNIKINRGYYTNIRTEYQFLIQEINSIQTEIIKTKLKILFGYTSEDDAIKDFDKLRKRLAGLTKAHDKVKIAYVNILNNGVSSTEKDKASQELSGIVIELNKLSQDYDNSPGRGYITNMVEIYIDRIVPLVDKIKTMAYTYSSLEEIDGVDDGPPLIKLVQEPFTLNELYISGSDRARVINV